MSQEISKKPEVPPEEFLNKLEVLPRAICTRCGYKWTPNSKHKDGSNLPKACPSCGSVYWNKARRRGIERIAQNEQRMKNLEAKVEELGETLRQVLESMEKT